MSNLKESLSQFGSFHENELVAIEREGNNLKLKIAEKTCADREADRRVVRSVELICKSIVRIAMDGKEADDGDYKAVELDWTSAFESFDFTIIHMEGSADANNDSVVIHWEGNVDDRFFASAKLVITAKKIVVKASELVPTKAPAEQNDARADWK